jgi:hypothetical protein
LADWREETEGFKDGRGENWEFSELFGCWWAVGTEGGDLGEDEVLIFLGNEYVLELGFTTKAGFEVKKMVSRTGFLASRYKVDTSASSGFS